MILACKNFMNVITKISNLRVDGNFSASIIFCVHHNISPARESLTHETAEGASTHETLRQKNCKRFNDSEAKFCNRC